MIILCINSLLSGFNWACLIHRSSPFLFVPVSFVCGVSTLTSCRDAKYFTSVCGIYLLFARVSNSIYECYLLLVECVCALEISGVHLSVVMLTSREMVCRLEVGPILLKKAYFLKKAGKIPRLSFLRKVARPILASCHEDFSAVGKANHRLA